LRRSFGNEICNGSGMAHAGKGKPTKQVADERKERETARAGDAQPGRSVHRFDRSKSDEKGGKGGGNVEDARKIPSGGQQRRIQAR
jgi:hypothetical protein